MPRVIELIRTMGVSPMASRILAQTFLTASLCHDRFLASGGICKRPPFCAILHAGPLGRTAVLQARFFARLALLTAVCGLMAAAQAPTQITAADYARAEQALAFNTSPLIFNASLRPGWLPDGRFWYRADAATGAEYYLVDPAHASREAAFNQAKIAAALSTASGQTYTADHLALDALTFSPDNRPAPEEPGGRGGRGGRGAGGRGAASGPTLAVSPDRKHAVFIRDWNLWLRDMTTHQDTQLTTDGVENFGYATDNAGWTSSDRPIVLWSPDSTKIATYQQDQRGVGKLYLVPVVVGHPQLTTQVYPLPGDKVVTTIQRVIIDWNATGGAKVIRLQMPPDQHRSTTSDNLAWGPNQDVQWSSDGSHLAFISTSRGHNDEHLRIADAATGAVRDVYEEKVATQYEGGQGGSNFRYLSDTNEFLWYSQRDDLGQLYLYDANTGKLKNQVTTLADGNVDSVVRVDPKAREVYFLATAQKNENPYYMHLYRASLDGARQELLTPEDANHTISLAPDGEYFTDTFSTPTVPPATVLRSVSGKLVMPLEKADISRLV